MTLTRTLLSTLPLLAGFAVLLNQSSAQDPALPKKDISAFDEVNLQKEARGIPQGDLPKVKQAFHAYAKYYADLIANPLVYKAANDPKFGSNVQSTIPTFDRSSQYGFLRDIDRYILVPVPTSKDVSNEKADYIRELGIAFDGVLKPLIETHQERIVRLNATRLLAEVCRSGAHAHWPTVTALLSNENTPTEIKHYALQAAAHLLATSDMNEYKWRKHANDSKAVGALVEAVTNCILKPNMIIPGFKPETATQNQLEVINFVRKQAIRALAQVHFATIPGPDGKTPLYPAYTLAQVCVSDPRLVPSPTPAECGEAALGLCNMAPSMNGAPFKTFNPRAAAEAFAAGMVTFSSPRADATDRSLPWRQYGVRITEGFKNWKPLFNPLFDATTPPSSDDGSSVPPIINDLIGRVQTFVLIPIEKVDASGKTDINSNVNIEGMKDFLTQLRESPDRKPLLFSDRPETEIYKPAAK
jgi:hypothetical protein